MFDINTCHEIFVFILENNRYLSMTTTSDNKYIVFLCTGISPTLETLTVQFFDIESQKVVRTIDNFLSMVDIKFQYMSQKIIVTNDSKYIIVTIDNFLYVLEFNTGNIKLKQKIDRISSLYATADSKTIIVGSNESIHLIDLETSNCTEMNCHDCVFVWPVPHMIINT